MFVPQVLGVGYGHVSDALNGKMTLQLMALLVLLKLLAVTTSYASGNAGGIFGPSLFIGAMLGGAVGSVAHLLLPGHTATQGAYALVGMGAAFAGIVRAPMTSVMMIFEVTRDYAIIVPLMISNLVSFFLSARLQRQPIYEALAHQDGLHLPTAATRQHLGGRQVLHAMRPPGETLSARLAVREALDLARSGAFRSWPVTDEQGVLGVVDLGALEQAVAEGAGAKPLGELFDSQTFPHVHADQALHLALERMGAAGLDLLPVVSRSNVRELRGVVALRDVLAAYGFGEGPPRRPGELSEAPKQDR